MEADSRVTDIRWMAYMLATAYWETSHIVQKQKITINKMTHKPVIRQVKVWQNMSPVEEVGHGKTAKGTKDYYLPVKVQQLPNGTAIVTEYDGDQWTVNIAGVRKEVTKGNTVGANPAGPVAPAFAADRSTEHAYFGRGYVQLTWWTNYASTGAAIGEALNLLFEPERALEPKIAYAVMARGMIAGAGFANGHKLSDYFHGAHTDYVNARAMVNGVDHKVDIARIAQLFESVLLQKKDKDSLTEADKNNFGYGMKCGFKLPDNQPPKDVQTEWKKRAKRGSAANIKNALTATTGFDTKSRDRFLSREMIPPPTGDTIYTQVYAALRASDPNSTKSDTLELMTAAICELAL
jgi:hypothetical protein